LSSILFEQVWSPDAILKVVNKEIFLPQIQRGYEWKHERIEKFFDSLVKGIPLGLVLLYQHDGSFELHGRRFFEAYDQATENLQYKYDTKIDSGKLVVLDGQQRLQTLYLGLKGSFYDEVLYHDVSWVTRPPSQESTFQFRSKSESSCLCEDDQILIRTPALYSISGKLSKVVAFNRSEKLENFRKITSEEGITSIPEDQIEGVFDYVSDNLKTAFLTPEYFVRLLKLQIIHPLEIRAGRNQLSNLLEIFIRFNQGGMRLEKSDLMFSVLKAQGWVESEYDSNELSRETTISKDLLIKAQMIVAGLDVRDDIYKAAEHIRELKAGFEDFKSVIHQLYDRIVALTELPEEIFNKFNFLIPAVYYCSKQKDALKKTPLSLDLLRYILVVVFNSNLRSDNYLQRLVTTVKESLESGSTVFPLDKLLSYMSQLGVKTELDGDSLNRNPLLAFSLLQRNNWRPLLRNNRLHVDHIFPEGKKDELSEGSSRYVDSFWNKYVVFQGDNIRKLATLPEDYFIDERALLKKDYIMPEDPSLIKKESFLHFIDWRQSTIASMFMNELGIAIVTNPIASD